MSNKTRDELERSFDCCGLFNLTTLDQQDYAFCTAVSWHGRGWGVAVVCVIENWLRPMLKLADLSLM